MSEFHGDVLRLEVSRLHYPEVSNGMTDPQVTGRLTSIMKKINLEDGTEARGVRVKSAHRELICMDSDLIKTFPFQVLFMCLIH